MIETLRTASSQAKLQKLRFNANYFLASAERSQHAYATALPMGEERVKAFKLFEALKYLNRVPVELRETTGRNPKEAPGQTAPIHYFTLLDK